MKNLLSLLILILVSLNTTFFLGYLSYKILLNDPYKPDTSLKKEIVKFFKDQNEKKEVIPQFYLNTYFENVDGKKIIKIGVLDKDHSIYLRDKIILISNTGLESPYALETLFVVFLFESEEDRELFYKRIQILYEKYKKEYPTDLSWGENGGFIQYIEIILTTHP